MRKATGLLLVGASAIALFPQAAFAQSARERALEARIQQLEAAVAALQSQVQTTQAQQQSVAAQTAAVSQRTEETAQRVAAIQAAPPPTPAPVPEGFRVGSTTFRAGGYIKTVASFSHWSDGEVAANSLGRDFYLPQAIPVGGGDSSTDNDFSAKQTRLWFSFESAVADHTLRGYIETDFQTATGTQGTERTTNGYDLALRRAYVQFDNLTVGQDWSTFQYVAALPESTDFVGATEGTVFSRQPLVRYTAHLSPQATLMVSAENAETSSVNWGTSTMVENDDDRMPDFAARVNYAGSFGELSLAGVVRELSVRNGGFDDHSMGFGASLAGKIPLGGSPFSDFRFMATYGTGISRYVGINLAPDVIVDPLTGELHRVDTFGAFAAVRVGLSPTVRSSLMASYQDVNYPDALPLAGMNALNDRAWSVAGNLFWSPVRGLDLGVEYRHGERRIVSGADGALDRLEFAVKYGF